MINVGPISSGQRTKRGIYFQEENLHVFNLGVRNMCDYICAILLCKHYVCTTWTDIEYIMGIEYITYKYILCIFADTDFILVGEMHIHTVLNLSNGTVWRFYTVLYSITYPISYLQKEIGRSNKGGDNCFAVIIKSNNTELQFNLARWNKIFHKASPMYVDFVHNENS